MFVVIRVSFDSVTICSSFSSSSSRELLVGDGSAVPVLAAATLSCVALVPRILLPCLRCSLGDADDLVFPSLPLRRSPSCSRFAAFEEST
ncbi:hypothetical protein GUJ93_ZPchr0012g18819 [Zizania palustris]|uniref:Uncharacterized protein n=1 Tax=Zizania palustris TaxID=103762 RepID=A0A8J5WQ11_ZIZPA|nr:hypothetical protein GUJ93_ZPchr0012g18819 [Zizania palustris]